MGPVTQTLIVMGTGTLTRRKSLLAVTRPILRISLMRRQSSLNRASMSLRLVPRGSVLGP